MEDSRELEDKVKVLEMQAELASGKAELARNALNSAHFLMHRVLRTSTSPSTTKDAHEACEYIWKALGELYEITDEVYGVDL